MIGFVFNRPDASRDQAGRRLLIDMVADGYPFPANLDVSPPVGGLAPPSQAEQTKRHFGLEND